MRGATLDIWEVAQESRYPESAVLEAFSVPRPLKWSRDLHTIRDRANRSRTETWSRQDIQDLFTVAPSSAQSLMKAIGGVQIVGGAHFTERTLLLEFLNELIAADSVEAAMQQRLAAAGPTPRRRSLRVTLPSDLRNAMLPDLPSNITLEPGRLEIRAETAVAMLESLVALATIMGNDLDRFQMVVEPPHIPQSNDALEALIDRMRAGTAKS